MDYVAVGLAGFLGAAARALLAEYISFGSSGDFPVNTLIINLTGCFLLCFFMRLTLDRLRVDPKFRLAAGTGFCGAYTTFSTFSLETVTLLRDGAVFTAFAYIIITALGCVLSGWLGISIVRLYARHEKRADPRTSGLQED